MACITQGAGDRTTLLPQERHYQSWDLLCISWPHPFPTWTPVKLFKPDSVMVVGCCQQPLQFSLIDFGLAHPSFAANPGVWVKLARYGAPEVMLHICFNEVIDMWSTRYPLHPGNIDYDVWGFVIGTQRARTGQQSDVQQCWRLKLLGGLHSRCYSTILKYIEDLEQLMDTRVPSEGFD